MVYHRRTFHLQRLIVDAWIKYESWKSLRKRQFRNFLSNTGYVIYSLVYDPKYCVLIVNSLLWPFNGEINNSYHHRNDYCLVVDKLLVNVCTPDVTFVNDPVRTIHLYLTIIHNYLFKHLLYLRMLQEQSIR